MLLKTLEVRRFGVTKKVPRGKKVPAGQSYSSRQEEELSEEELSEAEPSEEDSEEEGRKRSKGKQVVGKNLVKGGKKKQQLVSESEEEDSEEESEEDTGTGTTGRELSKDQEEEESEEEEPPVKQRKVMMKKPVWNLGKLIQKRTERAKKKLSQSIAVEDNEELPDLEKEKEIPVPVLVTVQEDGEQPCSSWNSGLLVVAVYEGQWFIAEICKEQNHIPKEYKRLSYTTIKGTNVFSWPDRKDIMLTLEEDIILRSVQVVPVNSRGHFGLNKVDYQKVLTLLVVVYFLNFKFIVFKGLEEGGGIGAILLPQTPKNFSFESLKSRPQFIFQEK